MTSPYEPVDLSPPASERAARAVMDEASRHGWAMDARTAERIADAVLACADTDIYVEQLIDGDVYDGFLAADTAGMGRLREHMRDRLAMQAARDGLLLTAMPHEVVDRPPGMLFMRRIRLIAPARKAPSARVAGARRAGAAG